MSLRLVDGHDPVGADVADGVGEVAGDLVIAVRGEPGHALQTALRGQGAGLRIQRGGGGGEPALHPPHDAHGVGSGGGGAVPLFHERGREDHCGGGAVADLVAHLRAHMADQAPAHVLEAVGEVDVPRDGVAVGRDPGLGVAAFDQHGTPRRGPGWCRRYGPRSPHPGAARSWPRAPRRPAWAPGCRRSSCRAPGLRPDASEGSRGARAPAQPL